MSWKEWKDDVATTYQIDQDRAAQIVEREPMTKAQWELYLRGKYGLRIYGRTAAATLRGVAPQ